MPVSRRAGSPFWWYSFNLNGRRFRGSTGRKTKREAQDVERDKRLLAERTFGKPRDWTLQVVLSTYWNEHAKHLESADEIERCFGDLQRILGKGKRTSELTDGDLMDYRAQRRGEERFGRFPQAFSINREFAYLRAAYGHCERFHKHAMPAIDWKGLRAKEPPPRTRFADRVEFTTIMEAAHPRIRPIIICAVATGLRKGNVLKLDWAQVSLDSRTITARVKGNKEFAVRIAPALMAVLSSLPHRKGPVFERRNFRKLWEKARKDAGCPDLRVHDLRHTFASWARQGGADIADIKEALNHSSVSMTMRYAHIKPDEAITAADRVSERLLGTFAGTEAQKTAENSGKAGD